MPIEIERKFLVTSDAWRAAAHEVVPMAQGYLNDLATVDSGAMKTSVRVRIAGDEAFLNLKSRELGHTRQEFDYPIPVADARALLALCVGGVIDKRRHYVDTCRPPVGSRRVPRRQRRAGRGRDRAGRRRRSLRQA